MVFSSGCILVTLIRRRKHCFLNPPESPCDTKTGATVVATVEGPPPLSAQCAPSVSQDNTSQPSPNSGGLSPPEYDPHAFVIWTNVEHTQRQRRISHFSLCRLSECTLFFRIISPSEGFCLAQAPLGSQSWWNFYHFTYVKSGLVQGFHAFWKTVTRSERYILYESPRPAHTRTRREFREILVTAAQRANVLNATSKWLEW